MANTEPVTMLDYRYFVLWFRPELQRWWVVHRGTRYGNGGDGFATIEEAKRYVDHSWTLALAGSGWPQ